MADLTYVRAEEGQEFEKLDSDTLRTITRTIRAANHLPTEEDNYYRCNLPKEILNDLLTDPKVVDISLQDMTVPGPDKLYGTAPAIYGMKFYPTENPAKGYLNVTVRGLPVSIE